MSINVNVTGNPICIKRGKMVIADPNFATKEFQKRRLIRLQQVREQSKQFAEKQRNKVRSAKTKQLSALEKEGEKEMKKWQARKLLMLQQQYRDCLKDIGLGHVQATLEDESEEMLLSQKESEEELVRNRGDDALQKLKENVQKEKDDKLECTGRRKYNKAVENARSAMVVSLHKTQSRAPLKKKKKEKPNIYICNELVSELESELELQVPINTKRLSLSDSNIELTRLPEKATCNQASDNDTRTTQHYPFDTRISDRIKRRELKCTNCALENGFLDDKVQTTHIDPQTATNQESQTSHRDLTVTELLKYNNEKFQRPSQNVQSELPSKPTLTLRSTDAHEMPLNSGNKVQYYDHQNRFSKEYEPILSSVRKINENSIEVCPSNDSEAEYVEQIYKRDRDAQIRGQKALEKVKVHRDYKEMMEQLPKLQKKERIASIACNNKPEFHMSGHRLQAHERKRQNRMENAYEKLFPQAQIVTIAPKSWSTKLGDKETKSKLNVGSWNFDTQKSSTSMGARSGESELLKQAGDKKSHQRKEKLKKMLNSLIEQRNKLARELKSLPETNRLHKVIDLGVIDELLESGHNLDKGSVFSTRRPQSPVAGSSHVRDEPRSRDTSPQLSPRTQPETESRKLRNEKRPTLKGNKSNSSSSSSSPPTKIINVATLKNKDVKSTQFTPPIRQTISTQTTPLKLKQETVKVDAVTETSAIKENKAVSAVAGKVSEESTKCNCCPNAHTDTCKIVIKICDDDNHKISVQKPKQKNVELVDKKNTVQFKTQKEKAKSQGYWHEVLSQNSSNSSTLYYSPPDFSQPMSKKQSSAPFQNNVQQCNIVNETTRSPTSTPSSNVRNEVLLGLIQRLLKMSRGSIDRFAVSDVSDVSTPNSSIINVESNNPKDHLENIMKHFNLNQSEIDRYLNASADHSNVHYNSAASTLSSNSKVSPSPRSQDIDEYAVDNYPGVLMAYNKMTENCAKKIENLAAMIEQVRLEKLDILEHSPFSGSDKENSTKYLDLPAQQNRTESPRGDSLEQEELTRQLLEIDYGHGERLTQKKAPERPQSPEIGPDLDTTDQELLTRFKQLKEGGGSQSDAAAPPPVWLDISRLPKFEAKSIPCCVTPNKKSKPPLSRGITMAMRYNENVSVPPHELSAIAEVDSFVSNRQYQPQSPSSRRSSRERSIREGKVNEITPALLGSIFQDIFDNNRNASECRPKTTEENNCSSTSLPDILSEIDNSIQILNTHKSTENSNEKSTSVDALINQKSVDSESSTSELENIEATLKHLGMGWAVATLRKTQEALALTSSSSSSMELSFKQSDNKRVLDPYLDTSKTNESSSVLSTFLRGLVSDLPQHDDTGSSGNKTSRKTSTPVQVSAGADKSTSNTQPNIIPTAESDLSSIRTSSNDIACDFTHFYSLNEASSNQTKDN